MNINWTSHALVHIQLDKSLPNGLLAIEAATVGCSVALSCGNTIFEKTVLEPRQQSERLLGLLESLLDETGLTKSDLKQLIVSAGI